VFEILQHTADVRLRVSASSVEELFRDAMRGMFAIMNPAMENDRREARLEIESVDRTALLVDFLSEVLTRSHVDRVAFDDATFESMTETNLRAEVHGHTAARFEQDIKAVTYHEADVREVNAEWQTTLVFDI